MTHITDLLWIIITEWQTDMDIHIYISYSQCNSETVFKSKSFLYSRINWQFNFCDYLAMLQPEYQKIKII